MDALSRPTTDLDRSAFFFRTRSTFDHTPRMRLSASCSRTDPGGASWTAYLTHPCIAESMYREADLIQEPVSRFTAIVIDGREVAFLRRTVLDARETRSAIAIGTEMPTHSGIPALMVELRVQLAPLGRTTPLRDAAAIQRAALDGTSIVGRTAFVREGAAYRLEYPVTTINAANDREAWQVDAGPVLLPTRRTAPGGMTVDGLEPGYLVYDAFDWLEVTSLGGDGEARPLRLSGSNELFAVG